MPKVELSVDELKTILEALSRHPDEEEYSFGPSYEHERRKASQLHARLSREVPSEARR